jgi:hypothetical protein
MQASAAGIGPVLVRRASAVSKPGKDNPRKPAVPACKMSRRESRNGPEHGGTGFMPISLPEHISEKKQENMNTCLFFVAIGPQLL